MPRTIQQDLTVPLLIEIASRGGSIAMRQLDYVVDVLADLFGLSPAARRERLPNGAPRFRNEVEWAKKLLLDSGHLDHIPRRNCYITAKGFRRIEHMLRSGLARLNEEDLVRLTERFKYLREDFPPLPNERLCALIHSSSQIKLLLQQPTEITKR